MMKKRRIIIGTRRSLLALRQTDMVRTALEGLWPEIEFETLTVTTEGDVKTDIPLSRIGGKGLFTKALEDRILNGEIDMAVHSLKDLPTALPPGLALGAVPARENPADVLISRGGLGFSALPAGAVVGTGSLRRSAQVLLARKDLVVRDIRGNVDTRLRKLDARDYDALVLAAAGLSRLGLSGRVTEELSWYHAAGQGALGIEIREGDGELRELLGPLEDLPTARFVAAERAFLQALGGGCHVPIGVRTRFEGPLLVLEGLVAEPDGSFGLTGIESGTSEEAEAVGRRLAHSLLERGARDILGGLQ